jgi:hypothetical protein
MAVRGRDQMNQKKNQENSRDAFLFASQKKQEKKTINFIIFLIFSTFYTVTNFFITI